MSREEKRHDCEESGEGKQRGGRVCRVKSKARQYSSAPPVERPTSERKGLTDLQPHRQPPRRDETPRRAPGDTDERHHLQDYLSGPRPGTALALNLCARPFALLVNTGPGLIVVLESDEPDRPRRAVPDPVGEEERPAQEDEGGDHARQGDNDG